jgi:polyhydroxybutyrate depolymerase
VAGIAVAVVPVGTSATGPCGALPKGSTTISLRQGNVNRTALLHVPSTYTGKTPVPLVLNLHGSGSTADQQRLFTAMNKTADADGFVVVYPQGAIADGSGYDWNVPGQPLVGGRKVPFGSPSDVSFAGALLTKIESTYCIDAHRVYATGFSGGARMSSELACSLSARIAAVAAVSGLRFPPDCHTTRAAPVLAFHGTADPVDPYAGHGQPYWTYSVPDAARRWAAHDGCLAKPMGMHQPGVTVTAYHGCRDGALVELYTIAGEGHEWPGGPTLPPALAKLLGPQSTAVSANAVMWAFFQAHRLP